MIIDIAYVIVLAIALLRGWKKGLVLGLFSLVAVIIGLAAALKLSAVVALKIGKAVKVSEEWLPLISFILVFIAVVWLIRLGAKFIERTLKLVLLGWANRLGGMIFYAAIFTLVFSVLLFYAGQMQWIKPATIRESVTYSFVQPWGPKAIDGLASIIPAFKNLFADLEHFFDNVSKRISTTGHGMDFDSPISSFSIFSSGTRA